MKPLFSIVILCYRSGALLFQMLDSVFRQSYPRIQLLISDDGSGDFDGSAVERYCHARQRSSVEELQVLSQPERRGTVAHLESVLPLCRGDYIWPLAADDVIANEDAVACFVQHFQSAQPETLLMTSQVELYDQQLQTKLGCYISSRQIDLLKTGTAREQFMRFARCCWIPAVGTCFKRELPAVTGRLSPRFYLVEDWPLYIRATLSGARIGWSDMTSVRHRHGGVSHGRNRSDTAAAASYSDDLLAVYHWEIRPHLGLLPPPARARVVIRAMMRYLHHRGLWFRPLRGN